jgi:hypothetical protein
MTDAAEDLATPSQRMLRVTAIGGDEAREVRRPHGPSGEAITSSIGLFAGQIMGRQIGAVVGSMFAPAQGGYPSQIVAGLALAGSYALCAERTYEVLSWYGAPVAFDPAQTLPRPCVISLSSERIVDNTLVEQMALSMTDEIDVEFLSNAIVVPWATFAAPAFLVDAAELDEVRVAEAERRDRFEAALREEDDAWMYVQGD